MGWGIAQGLRSLKGDAPAERLTLDSQGTLNFKVLSNYKALKTTLRLSGKIKVSSTSAPSDDAVVNINYKDDHFFNMLKGFQFKADNDVIKNLQNNLAFFRFWLVYVQEGHESLQTIPQSITIKQNETSGEADFKVDIVIPFLMYDMLNIWQTCLLTWLYKSIYATFSTAKSASDIIKSVETTNETIKDKLSVEFVNPFVESYTDYEIVDNSYLSTNESGKALTAQEVLIKIGGNFKVETLTSNFKSQGTSQFIKLLPTNIQIFKDLWVIVRDAETGERVDDCIDKITLKDGDRSIVDIDPRAIRNGDIHKYKISPNLWAEKNMAYPDKKGVLHGVYRIDGSNFNNLTNSKMATYSWNNPMVYFDINENITKHTNGLNFEVVQCYKEVSDSVQKAANAYSSSASVTQTS